MILSIKSSTPKPDFALTLNISFWLISRSSDKSFFTASTSADGKSILFITGMIIRFSSLAILKWAIVWASRPWVASTKSITPSHADKDLETSYEKSTWPGVSIILILKVSPIYVEFKLTVWAFIVIPRSLSKSIESKICSFIFRELISPYFSMRRSASVDLPWSIWATIAIFRIFIIAL